MTIQLIHGDCLEVMRDIPDGSVDMVMTDIPYGKVNRKSNGLRNLYKGNADIVNFDLSQLITGLSRVCGKSIYIFCGTEQVSEIRSTLVKNGYSTRLGIWEKTNPSPMNGQYIWLSSVECCVYGKKSGAIFNEHCKSSVWRFPTARGKLHPTMKPVKLIEYLINTSSTTNDLIFDPFMGSGTTGVAAKNLNRKFIGIELNEDYFNIAKARIEAT